MQVADHNSIKEAVRASYFLVPVIDRLNAETTMKQALESYKADELKLLQGYGVTSKQLWAYRIDRKFKLANGKLCFCDMCIRRYDVRHQQVVFG